MKFSKFHRKCWNFQIFEKIWTGRKNTVRKSSLSRNRSIKIYFFYCIILSYTTQYNFWARFVKIIGCNRVEQELFWKIISSPRPVTRAIVVGNRSRCLVKTRESGTNVTNTYHRANRTNIISINSWKNIVLLLWWVYDLYYKISKSSREAIIGSSWVHFDQ